MRKYFKTGKIIFWIGLVFAIYMFVILAVETSQNYSLRFKSEVLESNISRLEDQIADLGYKVTYYKTDSYRERLAREKLNVAAPGESVVIIRDTKRNNSESNNDSQIRSATVVKTDAESISEKPNYQQWRIFLFGN